MPDTTCPLKIAYAIQNVGQIEFSTDLGDAVPVKQSLLGLHWAGHTVVCVRLRKRAVFRYELPGFDEAGRVPIGWINSGPFLSLESGLRRLQKLLNLRYYAVWDSLRFYKGCRAVLPEFDLCHEHNGLFSVGAALACRRLNLPYVLTVSADLLRERKLSGQALTGVHARWAAAAAVYTYHQADRILCVSASAGRHLAGEYGIPEEKISVIPNGVDTDRFKPGDEANEPLRRALGTREDRLVTFVGTFQPWHGLDLLVEAFSEIRARAPGTRLLLVGDGRARETVEATIDRCGVRDGVTITGLLPQERIPEILAISDVAVMPYPGLPGDLWFSPLKMYEYMAAGKAIVASTGGQISEVIRDGHNGVLVEPGDVRALAEACAGLLLDPEERRRLGGNARKDALARHSWTVYTERLERIYRMTLELKAGGAGVRIRRPAT
ncbi:MAG TPA: glycosyltransferase family 4 protein [Anaerolineales bacterium]|nr:glycosyltransferase family 4 protein [Anaerolineales bacterium]